MKLTKIKQKFLFAHMFFFLIFFEGCFCFNSNLKSIKRLGDHSTNKGQDGNKNNKKVGYRKSAFKKIMTHNPRSNIKYNFQQNQKVVQSSSLKKPTKGRISKVSHNNRNNNNIIPNNNNQIKNQSNGKYNNRNNNNQSNRKQNPNNNNRFNHTQVINNEPSFQETQNNNIDNNEPSHKQDPNFTSQQNMQSNLNNNPNGEENNNQNMQNSTEKEDNPNPNVSTPFIHPMGNFIFGMGEELANADTSFLACFPENWKSKDQPDIKETNNAGVIAEMIGNWASAFGIFLNMTGGTIDFFCKFKENVVNFIHGIFIKHKLRKFKKMLKKGKLKKVVKILSKKYSWGWLKKVGDTVKNGINNLDNKISNATKNVGNFIKENLISPIFSRWFKSVEEKFMEVINKIKDFFLGDLMSKIQVCVDNLAPVINGMHDIFLGLRGKFKTLKFAVSKGVPSLIIWAIDFLVALICEHKVLLQAVNFIAKGVKLVDNNQKLYLFGKSIGLMFRTFSKSQTVSENLFKKPKFKKLYYLK